MKNAMGFAFFVLLAIGVPFQFAHADFAVVSYETTSFPDEACSLNPPASTDFMDASSFLEETVQSFNLTSNAQYYMGDSNCSWETDRIFKIYRLYQGSAADIARLVANPPSYNGRLMSFAFQVAPFKQMIAHYYLSNYVVPSDMIADILDRPVDDIWGEWNGFVEQVCQPSPQNLLGALAGTPDQQAAEAYVEKYSDQWTLSYDGELISDSGASTKIAGNVWVCPQSVPPVSR